MGNPRTGYYQCPRCNSQKVYESEETIGAMGMTLDAPGPVDPMLINRVTGKVSRCFDCGEKAIWHDSAETQAYKAKRDSSVTTVISFIGGFVFLFLGLWIIGEDLEGTTGLKIGAFVASGFFFLMGVATASDNKNS
jgi:hypothetical protein